MPVKRRWTVLFPATEKYLSDPRGETNGVAWDRDPKTAQMMAGRDGVVVDADWLANHWHEWKETREIPSWALPDSDQAIGHPVGKLSVPTETHPDGRRKKSAAAPEGSDGESD